MILKKITIDKDGQVETLFVLNPEQYHALVNHAINDLMMKGIIKIMDLPIEEEEKLKQEALEEAQRTFLEQVEVTDLHKA